MTACVPLTASRPSSRLEPQRPIGVLLPFESQLDLAAALGVSNELIYVVRIPGRGSGAAAVRELAFLSEVMPELQLVVVKEEGPGAEQLLRSDLQRLVSLAGARRLFGYINHPGGLLRQAAWP